MGNVAAIVTVLILLAGVSAGLVAWKLWTDARATAEREAHNLGVVFTEQTLRSFQGASLVLQEFEAAAERGDAGTPERFDAAFGSRAFHDEMASRSKDLPQAGVLEIVSAHGTLLNTSRIWPAPSVNVARRDYVAFCQQPTHPGLFISATYRGQGNDLPTFYLVRCISGPDGELLGIAAAAMRVDYFMDFYQKIGLPDGTSIAMRRLGGDLLVRYPNAGPDAPVATPAATGSGRRLVAAFTLASYPVSIEVGLSDAQAFRQWRQQVTWVVVGSMCAVASLLILLQRLIGAVGGLTRARDTLVQRNNALMVTRLRLERQAIDLAEGANALRESEARLSRQSSVLQTTLEHMDQGLMMVTADRTVAVCNRRAAAMLDLPPALMEAKPDFSQVLAQQWQMEEFQAAPVDIKAMVRAGGLLDQPHTYERRRPNGTILEVRSIPLEGGGMVRTYTDITHRKLAEERLTYIAFHDELTGLANRYAMREALEAAVVATRPNADGSALAVLYIDLDRFKLVNDTRGHAVGDLLLQQVARRIASCLRCRAIPSPGWAVMSSRPCCHPAPTTSRRWRWPSASRPPSANPSN